MAKILRHFTEIETRIYPDNIYWCKLFDNKPLFLLYTIYEITHLKWVL